MTQMQMQPQLQRQEKQQEDVQRSRQSARAPRALDTVAPTQERRAAAQPKTVVADPELQADELRSEVEYQSLIEAFDAYCKEVGDYNPPTPLDADAARLFAAYEATQEKEPSAPRAQALTRYRTKLSQALAPVERKMDALQRRLMWKRLLSFGVPRHLLGRVTISTTLDSASPKVSAQIERAARLLALQWTENLDKETQGLFSVYQDEEKGQTIIQIGMGGIGSIFLALPQILDPLEVARQILDCMRGVFESALEDADPIAVVNGAFPEFNMKELLPAAVVVRSRAGDKTEQMRERIAELYARPPLSVENTQIVSALPISREEMVAVLGHEAGWDIWGSVAEEWTGATTRQGFALADSATAPAFLDALGRKQNVIVLVAHAEQDCLYFPQPQPEGSRVTPDDIRAMRDQIEQNRPAVYLFCCETAEYRAGVQSVSEALLECGAAAVVAPQQIIRADRSLKLFEEFLKRGSHEIPLLGLRDAERAAQNRDLETWLG